MIFFHPVLSSTSMQNGKYCHAFGTVLRFAIKVITILNTYTMFKGYLSKLPFRRKCVEALEHWRKPFPPKTHPTTSMYNMKILFHLVRWFLGSRPCFQNKCESIRENLATKVYTPPWPLPWHGPTRPPWLCYLPLYLPGTEFPRVVCIELLDCNELLVAVSTSRTVFFQKVGELFWKVQSAVIGKILFWGSKYSYSFTWENKITPLKLLEHRLTPNTYSLW